MKSDRNRRCTTCCHPFISTFCTFNFFRTPEQLIENFPEAKLRSLIAKISSPRWVVPVLPDQELECLLNYAIELTKAGKWSHIKCRCIFACYSIINCVWRSLFLRRIIRSSRCRWGLWHVHTFLSWRVDGVIYENSDRWSRQFLEI